MTPSHSHQIAVGEALLNDGMALVLFEALITPQFDTPVKVVYYFLRVIFISPFLGFAFGIGKNVYKMAFLTLACQTLTNSWCTSGSQN